MIVIDGRCLECGAVLSECPSCGDYQCRCPVAWASLLKSEERLVMPSQHYRRQDKTPYTRDPFLGQRGRRRFYDDD